MSLAINYRPKTFDEVVGNESTIKALQTLLSRNIKDIPHAFLLTGPSGCGKTTFGRLIKTALNCVGSDYHEMDTADFRGIDTVREMRTKMRFAAGEGDTRVFLLDECHGLTKDAQNAILKALEDAPEHVYFILCTTDPQKLLKTIVGRCVQFAVQPLTEKQMILLLQEVVEAEGKTVSAEVLEQIAQDSLGSSRNALQTLEKIIDLSGREQSKAATRFAAEQNQAIDLCRLLMTGKKAPWKDIAATIKGLEEIEIEQIRLAVMGYCAACMLNRHSDEAFIIMMAFKEPFYNNGRSGLVLACADVYDQMK